MGRMCTPSKSDNQSGAQYNAAYNAAGLGQTVTPPPASKEVDNRRRKLSKTILTGPEGLDMDFETTKKTLLGE